MHRDTGIPEDETVRPGAIEVQRWTRSSCIYEDNLVPDDRAELC